jgi:uncharacterized membrane protein
MFNGHLDSAVLGIVGVVVALIAVVGTLALEWSRGSGNTVLTTIGTFIAVLVIAWSFYRVESIN